MPVQLLPFILGNFSIFPIALLIIAEHSFWYSKTTGNSIWTLHILVDQFLVSPIPKAIQQDIDDTFPLPPFTWIKDKLSKDDEWAEGDQKKFLAIVKKHLLGRFPFIIALSPLAHHPSAKDFCSQAIAESSSKFLYVLPLLKL